MLRFKWLCQKGKCTTRYFCELKLQIFFFLFFRIFFVEGNLTEWNPDKITSARQAQMREWSSSLLLITVLWTSTKIKLLHENTEYRQDNLLVYGITSKIMPRIMQVPWYTMDEGKSQVNKGSLIRWWRGQRDLHFSEETAPGSSASFKERMKFTQWLHLGDVRKWVLFCPLCYQPLNGWKDPFLSTEPCLHISLRSPNFTHCRCWKMQPSRSCLDQRYQYHLHRLVHSCAATIRPVPGTAATKILGKRGSRQKDQPRSNSPGRVQDCCNGKRVVNPKKPVPTAPCFPELDRGQNAGGSGGSLPR